MQERFDALADVSMSRSPPKSVGSDAIVKQSQVLNLPPECAFQTIRLSPISLPRSSRSLPSPVRIRSEPAPKRSQWRCDRKGRSRRPAVCRFRQACKRGPRSTSTGGGADTFPWRNRSTDRRPSASGSPQFLGQSHLVSSFSCKYRQRDEPEKRVKPFPLKERLQPKPKMPQVST